jgi:hypothetical protein
MRGALGIGIAGVALVGALMLVSARGFALPLGGSALRAPALQLHTVDFLGLEQLRPEPLLALTDLRADVPLVDVDLDAVVAAIAGHPRVAACRAARVPPDGLIVEIEERRPIAALAGRSEGFDREGERFPLVAGEADGLTVVEGDPALALPLLLAADEAGLEVARVAATAAHDVRFVPAGTDVEVRTGREPERSIEDWKRLSRSGLLGARAAREVDLRFRGRAVLRESKSGGEERHGSK